MIVVLTGGRGLIGRALNQRLTQEGHTVRLLLRPEWDGERDVPPLATLKDADAVIHLAGENVAARRWSQTWRDHLVRSRIESAKNLKLGLSRAGVEPKIFITASGVGYYGDRGDEVLDEGSRAGGDFLAELCQKWEAAADAGAQRTVKCRFGAVLSAGGGFLASVTPMMRRLGASRLGPGTQWLSWIHLDDAVAALMFILSHDLQGPVNIVAPEPLINAQWTEDLRRALRTFRAPPVPKFALRLVLGEFANVLLASQRAIPGKLRAAGFKWQYRDFESAVQRECSS